MKGSRSAFLVRCTVEDASKARSAARSEDRTVSGYVLHILRATWPLQDKLRDDSMYLQDLNLSDVRTADSRMNSGPQSQQSALLVRCSTDEAKRVRLSARGRGLTLSAYVVSALRRHWRIQEKLKRDLQDFQKTRQFLWQSNRIK